MLRSDYSARLSVLGALCTYEEEALFDFSNYVCLALLPQLCALYAKVDCMFICNTIDIDIGNYAVDPQKNKMEARFPYIYLFDFLLQFVLILALLAGLALAVFSVKIVTYHITRNSCTRTATIGNYWTV